MDQKKRSSAKKYQINLVLHLRIYFISIKIMYYLCVTLCSSIRDLRFNCVSSDEHGVIFSKNVSRDRQYVLCNTLTLHNGHRFFILVHDSMQT